MSGRGLSPGSSRRGGTAVGRVLNNAVASLALHLSDCRISNRAPSPSPPCVRVALGGRPAARRCPGDGRDVPPASGLAPALAKHDRGRVFAVATALAGSLLYARCDGCAPQATDSRRRQSTLSSSPRPARTAGRAAGSRPGWDARRLGRAATAARRSAPPRARSAAGCLSARFAVGGCWRRRS